MKAFRFRAQAALDLRQREYDDARRGLARAQMDLRAAHEVLGAADARISEARTRCATEMSATSDAERFQWYRFWILRLQHERAACANAATAREEDVARATAACITARQRVESLEQFRNRARQAWDLAVLAEEQKLFDDLATLRHVAATRESAARSRT